MNSLSFNVAIAALIELNNELVASERLPREVAEPMVLCLAPLAPHIAEELWHRLGHEKSLSQEPWPAYDPAMLVEDEVEYPVQINGKLRGRITVAADADDKTIEAAAWDDAKIKAELKGKSGAQGHCREGADGEYCGGGVMAPKLLVEDCFVD